MDAFIQTYTLNKFKVKHKPKLNHRRKFLTTRRRLRLGLGKIGYGSNIKYSDVLPLNQLWLKYMKEMLGNKSFTSIPDNPTNPNWENINQQLIKADFHGAKILINRSKCPTLAGLIGIVIQDTKNSFKICGTDNVIRSKWHIISKMMNHLWIIVPYFFFQQYQKTWLQFIFI